MGNRVEENEKTLVKRIKKNRVPEDRRWQLTLHLNF